MMLLTFLTVYILDIVRDLVPASAGVLKATKNRPSSLELHAAGC